MVQQVRHISDFVDQLESFSCLVKLRNSLVKLWEGQGKHPSYGKLTKYTDSQVTRELTYICIEKWLGWSKLDTAAE